MHIKRAGIDLAKQVFFKCTTLMVRKGQCDANSYSECKKESNICHFYCVFSVK